MARKDNETQQQSEPQTDETKTEAVDVDKSNEDGSTVSAAVDGNAEVPEAEAKALRVDTGADQHAGHTSTLKAWESSPQGQEWIAKADEREKEVQAQAEAENQSTEEDQQKAKAYEEALPGE